MEIFKRIDDSEKQLLSISQHFFAYYKLVLDLTIFIVLIFLWNFFFWFWIYFYLIFFSIFSILILKSYLTLTTIFLSKILLTSKRFIFISKLSYFESIPNQIFFDEIDEIKVKKEWFFQNYLNFWTITIFTKTWVFDFKYQKNPIELSKEILTKIKELE